MKQYPKALNPYLKSAEELHQIRLDGNSIHDGVLWQLVIPIKYQAWMTPGCPSIKHFLHYRDDAWAMRVGYEGDDYAGHVGTAWCPFVAGEIAEFQNRSNPRDVVRIKAHYIIPVKVNDRWFWRVEYRLVP